MSDTIWLEVTDGNEKTGGDRDNSILLEELEHCHSSLVDAEQRGHRFHLFIVP